MLSKLQMEELCLTHFGFMHECSHVLPFSHNPCGLHPSRLLLNKLAAAPNLHPCMTRRAHTHTHARLARTHTPGIKRLLV